MPPGLEHFLDTKEVHPPLCLLPHVVVVDHVTPLAAKDPDIVRMVVALVVVDMVDDFTWEKRATWFPFGYSPVLVVLLTGTVGARAVERAFSG